MPWARIGDPVTLGSVTFFDYPGEDVEALLSPEDRSFLDRIKPAYVTWPDQQEVKTLVLAVIDTEHPLRELSRNERRVVDRAGHALAFACLAHGYHHPFLQCSSDNFLLYHQLFDGSPGMAVQFRTGLHAFSDASLLRFVCPPWAPSALTPIRPHEGFTAGLAPLLARSEEPAIRRLWLALESFFYAMTDSEMSKGTWRLMHLNVAFEALLNFGNSKQFVSRIGSLYAPYARQHEPATLFDDKTANYNLAELWAYDFYSVRNRIVHGDARADVALFWRDIRSHDEIAVRLFRICVLETLAKLVGEEVLGGPALRIVDSGFDDWIVNDSDPHVVQRRKRTQGNS